MTGQYDLYGVEPSFYTQKGLAILKAKALPHAFVYKSFAVRAEVEAAVDGYTKMPVVRTPRGDWLFDTTDIGLELDQRHRDTALLPTDPVWAAIGRLLDDWVDEWLVRPAVHWRVQVTGAASPVWCCIARNLMGLDRHQPLIDEQAARMHNLADRMIPVAERIGRTNRAGAGFESEIESLLAEAADHLTALFAVQPFLLGDAPSLADTGLAGALAGHLLWEDEPRAWVAARAPALPAYAARMETARAVASWSLPSALPAPLHALLALIARSFHPFLAANRLAIATRAEEARWADIAMPARPYTEGLRAGFEQRLEALSLSDSIRLGKLTAGTGVLDVFTP